jgi:hypothetical protein
MATSATATVAAAIVGNTGVLAQAGQPEIAKWLINFEFTFDPRTLDQGRAGAATAPPTAGPIYLAGPIYAVGSLNPDGTPKADAQQRGFHRFFGWLYDPANMLVIGTHTFDIAGRGKIVVGGASDNLSGAITGGTGDFKFANGEIRVDVISRTNIAYRAQIELSGGSAGE